MGDGSDFGLRVEYIEQDAPSGLAHAVLTAEPFLGSSPFVMYLGDNLLRDGIVDLVKSFRSESPDALILLTPVPDPESYGVAELNGDGAGGTAGGEAEGPEDEPRARRRLHVHAVDLRRGTLDRAVLARRARDHRRDPDAGGARPAGGPAHRARLVEGHRPGAGHARGQPPDPRRPRGAHGRRGDRLARGGPRGDRGGRPARARHRPRAGHHRPRLAHHRRLHRPVHGDRRRRGDREGRARALDRALRLVGERPRVPDRGEPDRQERAHPAAARRCRRPTASWWATTRTCRSCEGARGRRRRNARPGRGAGARRRSGGAHACRAGRDRRARPCAPPSRRPAPTWCSTAPPTRTWTAPRSRGRGRAAGERRRRAGIVAAAAPAVLYVSSDYVFDGTQGRALRGVRRHAARCRATAARSWPGRSPPRPPTRATSSSARRGCSAPVARTSWTRCCGWARARRGARGGRPGGLPHLHGPPGARRWCGSRPASDYGIHHAAAAGLLLVRPRERRVRARRRGLPARADHHRGVPAARAAPGLLGARHGARRRCCRPGRRGSTPTWPSARCTHEAARDRSGRVHRLHLRAARGGRARRGGARQAHLRRAPREPARGRAARGGRDRGPGRWCAR